jgi:GAF domain-containing protein
MAEYPDELAERVAELSMLLVEEDPIEATLDRVMRLVADQIDGVDLVGVSLMRDGKVETAVCTDHEAAEIDDVQYQTGIGPCLDAFRDREVKRIDSTPDDRQWLKFSRAAAEHGVLSTLSLPLVVRGEGIGALNLYSKAARSFDEADERLGMRFAEQASVALANARLYRSTYELTEQLNKALVSRAVIDQAKGIIMRTSRVDADQAFELLKQQSQHENRKLRDVAQDLVDQQTRTLRGAARPAERPSADNGRGRVSASDRAPDTTE